MSLQIPVEIEYQIEALGRLTGESEDHLVREAILTYLEDREDAMIAAERLNRHGKRTSLEEIGRKYGLED